MIRKDSLKKCIACFLFLTILAVSYFGISALVGIGVNPNDYNRHNMEGFAQEPEDSLDMVYIGGSAAFVYWQTMRAWDKWGLTSYSYATDTLQAEGIRYYIDNVLKTQSPDLFVIDVRPFQYWSQAGDAKGLRTSTLNMGVFSPNRYALIRDYLRNHGSQQGVLPFYLDIIKYHSQYLSPLKGLNILLRGEPVRHPFKGWYWTDQYEALEEPEDHYDAPAVPLDPVCQRVLEDLLSYCKEQELQVLFVVSPYEITEEHAGKYRSIQSTVEDYGYAFLDANLHYTDMDLDFHTDFFNKDHVNVFGAEKYTDFLGTYITENYSLKNRKNDPVAPQWEEDAALFRQENEIHKQAVAALIQEAEDQTE